MKPSSRPMHLLSGAPRAYLFSSPRSSSHIRRSLSTSPALHRDTKSPPPPSSNSLGSFATFNTGPAPPRLPKEEQEIFESLQRASTGAFSTPRTPPQINQSPDSSLSEAEAGQATVDARVKKLSTGSTPGEEESQSKLKDQYDRVIEARGKGEELHPNVVRGAEPEFEGDVNPKTGEVGGPKNEPLRWGPSGEWTYNGRATDF